MAEFQQSHNSDQSKSLNFIQECPICEQEYQFDFMTVIEERDNVSLIHITCENCSASLLAVVVISKMGTSSIGVLTDLEPEDIPKVQSSTAFTHDQVLNFHLFLQEGNEFESAVLADLKHRIS